MHASNLIHPHPYAHAKGLGNLLEQRARFLRQLGGPESSDKGTSSRENCVLPYRVPDRWDAGGSKVGFGGQNEDLHGDGRNCLW